MFLFNIIWLALMFSIPVLGFVLYQQGAAWPPKEGFLSDADFSVVPILAAAGFMIPFSVVFPKFLLSSTIRQYKTLPPGDSALRARNAYFMTTIVRLALSESVSINGFVCAQIKQNMQYYYLGAGIALVLFLLARPKLEDLRDVEHRLSGSHGNIR